MRQTIKSRYINKSKIIHHNLQQRSEQLPWGSCATLNQEILRDSSLYYNIN